MAASSFRTTLYRTARRAVTLAGAALILTQMMSGQSTGKASKGPRALALLELAPGGKAHLVPVTILFDGKFYDASAFKADPVPMALEAGTVYEAMRTGVSQGLFTVTGALQARNTWIGEGTWRPAGAAPPKQAAAPSHPPDEDLDAPPVLRREKPKAPEAPPAETKPPTPPAPAPAAPTAPAPAVNAPPESPADDSDRPVLHRGKPVQQPKPLPGNVTAKTPDTTSPSAKRPATASPEIQLIPAISDQGGAEPRPYAFDLKPGEEQQFRQKMLALAADEVRARVKLLASESVGNPKTAAKPPQPGFDDIQLRVFDLSNSNEPVLVMSATARIPQAPKTAAAEQHFYLTLVARQDVYGDLHKALSNVTDTRHLDALPRMELIDAVDADGDGRGELLFRQVSDAGNAFVIYRVIGDQLWALFRGTRE